VRETPRVNGAETRCRGPARRARLAALVTKPEERHHDRPRSGRSRGPRVPEWRPGNDGLGWQAPMAGCPDGDLDGDPRGQDGPPRADVHVGMRRAHQPGRRRSQQPARCAGFRRWTVTGSSAATCRPRTRAKRAGNPGWRPRAKIPVPAPPADPPGISRATGPPPGTAKPGVMCSPRHPSANLRSSPPGKNTRAHHRQPAHHQAARQRKWLPPRWSSRTGTARRARRPGCPTGSG
jgi:hypothetical protein